MYLLQEAIAGGMYMLIALVIGALVLLVGIIIYASTRENRAQRESASRDSRRTIKAPVLIILVVLLALVVIAVRWCSNFRYE